MHTGLRREEEGLAGFKATNLIGKCNTECSCGHAEDRSYIRARLHARIHKYHSSQFMKNM